MMPARRMPSAISSRASVNESFVFVIRHFRNLFEFQSLFDSFGRRMKPALGDFPHSLHLVVIDIFHVALGEPEKYHSLATRLEDQQYPVATRLDFAWTGHALFDQAATEISVNDALLNLSDR